LRGAAWAVIGATEWKRATRAGNANIKFGRGAMRVPVHDTYVALAVMQQQLGAVHYVLFLITKK